MKPIVLTLPYPPSVNHLYAVVRGRKVLSADGRAYQQEVALAVLQQGRPKAPDDLRLRVAIDLHPPDRRRRDVANAEKACVDAIVRCGVIDDDCLIDRLILTRRDVIAGGSVVLTIDAWHGEE